MRVFAYYSLFPSSPSVSPSVSLPCYLAPIRFDALINSLSLLVFERVFHKCCRHR